MNLKTYMDFKYEIKDNEVVIYKYVGDQEEVTVPDSIDGLPVSERRKTNVQRLILACRRQAHNI